VAPYASEREYLSQEDLLIRTSIALRGVRPTADELLEADPVSAWLDSDEFGLTMRDLHAESLRFRVDTVLQFPAMGVLEGVTVGDINRSTTEAPLRLIEDLIMRDQPYTEIVQADYMLADSIVADIYGLDHDPEGPPWQETWWVDGRPAAGVLSSSEFYHRYPSNGSNFHRGRANVISDVFLCDDISLRNIEIIDPPVATEADKVAEALATNEICAGCHQALEPIASFMWGFKAVLPPKAMGVYISSNCVFPAFDDLTLLPPGTPFAQDFCYPIKLYDPNFEHLWSELDLPPPALYGRQGTYISDLGRFIAEDRRFATCAAKRFYGYFTQIRHDQVDADLADALADGFIASGFDAKALARSVVTSEAFRTQKDHAIRDDAVGLLTLRPEHFARQIEALTGFVWLADVNGDACLEQCWGEVDLGRTNLYGYHSLAGGIDGLVRTAPTHTAMPTRSLSFTRLASEAAGFVVDSDLATDVKSDRRLLRLIDAGDTSELAVRTQIADLYARTQTQHQTADTVDDAYGLFADALARSGEDHAWKLVIAALLNDPMLVYY
jgi:hypothetical protein